MNEDFSPRRELTVELQGSTKNGQPCKIWYKEVDSLDKGSDMSFTNRVITRAYTALSAAEGKTVRTGSIEEIVIPEGKPAYADEAPLPDPSYDPFAEVEEEENVVASKKVGGCLTCGAETSAFMGVKDVHCYDHKPKCKVCNKPSSRKKDRDGKLTNEYWEIHFKCRQK